MIITEIKSAVMDDNIGTFYLKTEKNKNKKHTSARQVTGQRSLQFE